MKTLISNRNRKNVNHAGFDDVKKNLLDNDCQHKKGRGCESDGF